MQVIRLAVIISAKTNVKGLIDVDYLVNGTPDHEETFVMDALGNRTGNQTLTDPGVLAQRVYCLEICHFVSRTLRFGQ